MGAPSAGKGVAGTWYRFENFRYAGGVDEWGDPIPGDGRAAVRVVEIAVVKFTPKGAWVIDHYDDRKRFVLGAARKRYACPTIEEARASFVARKRRQIQILKARARDAEEALALALNEKEEPLLGFRFFSGV